MQVEQCCSALFCVTDAFQRFEKYKRRKRIRLNDELAAASKALKRSTQIGKTALWYPRISSEEGLLPGDITITP